MNIKQLLLIINIMALIALTIGLQNQWTGKNSQAGESEDGRDAHRSERRALFGEYQTELAG